MRPSLLALVLCLAAAGCRDAPVPEVDPSRTDAAERACLKDGGLWKVRESLGGMFCQRVPPDAGQACTRSTDCETECLARSRTCAPVSPLFGCHSVLDALGNVTEACLE